MPLLTDVRPLFALLTLSTLSLSAHAAGRYTYTNFGCVPEEEFCADSGFYGDDSDDWGNTGGGGFEYWQTVKTPSECYASFQADIQNAQRAREEYLASARNNAVDANGNFSTEYYDLAVQNALETYNAAYADAHAAYEDCIDEYYASEEEPQY